MSFPRYEEHFGSGVEWWPDVATAEEFSEVQTKGKRSMREVTAWSRQRHQRLPVRPYDRAP